jgi:hypothetical protein
MTTGEENRDTHIRLFKYLQSHPLFLGVKWVEEDRRQDPQAIAEIGFENCGWIYSVMGETCMTREYQAQLREEFRFDY